MNNFRHSRLSIRHSGEGIRHSGTSIRHSGEGRNPVKKIMLLGFILFASSTGVASAAELGRLFFTPQQRQQMDYRTTVGGSTTEEVNRNYIIVNGVVQKQGGKRTVWVNGAEQADGLSSGKNPTSAAVTPPGKSGTVRLKVGEKLLLDTPAPDTASEQRPAKADQEEDD